MDRLKVLTSVLINVFWHGYKRIKRTYGWHSAIILILPILLVNIKKESKFISKLVFLPINLVFLKFHVTGYTV